MNAVVIPTRAQSPWRDAASFAWRAWMATTRRQWAWVLAIGLVMVLVSLPHRVEMIREVGWFPLPAIAEALLPGLAAIPMFLGWVLADAGADTWRSRRTRLVVALLAAAAVTSVSGIALWHLAGADDVLAQLAAKQGKPPRSIALMMIAEYINMLVVGGMVYAVAEVFRQRKRTQLAFEATVRQQAGLSRQLLESRLSAMQAQVEPRFLFDTLVDIEALYEKDPQQAAGNLDRLIFYLRAALPRLRDSGTTVEAEIDLVDAYLGVVTSLHDGRPRLTVAVAEDCRQGRFYPMLLLPLVQRAVRRPTGMLPETIDIDARRDGRSVVVTLRIALTGGCADDPVLARVRERLAGLSDSRATIDCVEAAEGFTQLTLRLPADATAAAA